MPTYPKLDLDTTYHIYNRGNNRETIFHALEDYHAFLTGCHQRLPAFARILAYCLLGNHFHFGLQTFSEEEQRHVWETSSRFENRQGEKPFVLLEPSQQMRNLFSSYAMRFNRRYSRTGALFERPFERRVVDNDDYLRRLIVYIHRNPETHGLIDDFRKWPFSSYQLFLLPNLDPAQQFILDLFGGLDEFRVAHMTVPSAEALLPLWPIGPLPPPVAIQPTALGLS